MTLAEALSTIRARKTREALSAIAEWQRSRDLITGLYQILSAAPSPVVADFEFELTSDRRVSISRSRALIQDGDTSAGMPSVYGPLQIGSWRVERGRLVFYYWGNDSRSYQTADVSEAVLATAEVMLQQRAAEPPPAKPSPAAPTTSTESATGERPH